MIEVHEKPQAGLAIRLHENDNIVIARHDLPIGAKLEREGLTLKSQVPAGNKVAARAIRKGEPILKYNIVIGFASADIAPGMYALYTECTGCLVVTSLQGMFRVE